jgi:hypothetical protein
LGSFWKSAKSCFLLCCEGLQFLLVTANQRCS